MERAEDRDQHAPKRWSMAVPCGCGTAQAGAAHFCKGTALQTKWQHSANRPHTKQWRVERLVEGDACQQHAGLACAAAIIIFHTGPGTPRP